jgi:Arc/MetJ family transcription regulator
MIRGRMPEFYKTRVIMALDLLVIYRIVYTLSDNVIYKEANMGTAVKMTSIRLDTRLADKAVKALGVKNRTEAVHIALREIVALNDFRKLMADHAGKLRFEGHGE